MNLLPILVVCSLGFGLTPAWAFESPEHRSAGDAAWEKALAAISAGDHEAHERLAALLAAHPGVKPTKDEPICAVSGGHALACFSFGQLVAIYGDWANDVPEVNSPAIVGRAQMLKNITKDGDKAANKVEIDHMLELAKVNFTHFSGEALAAYVKWHQQALNAAGSKQLTEALHYEALALHSYTDLFALGHMLQDRELTKSLTASAKGIAILTPGAGAAAMVFGGMVNFYHNAYNWKGGMVRNGAGEEWRATGDGRYFDADNKLQRDMVVGGAADSLKMVLNVALGLPNPPASKFAAVRHLPTHYWKTQQPVPPMEQKMNIINLVIAQQKAGTPLQEHGFDFSLGILKYKTGEVQGDVPYAPQVQV